MMLIQVLGIQRDKSLLSLLLIVLGMASISHLQAFLIEHFFVVYHLEIYISIGWKYPLSIFPRYFLLGREKCHNCFSF